MLKMRLKRVGRKFLPSYRIVVMENTTKRDGKPVEELGFFNPLNDEIKLNKDRILERLKQGVKPSPKVLSLLKNNNVL
jgi:small subunit ribosomal protein S16